ncbi:bifunctional homocysteine S-methyltransferase/methylenetetrahydrofolate reductase [Salipaludibacillus agaradhaerens]|jgi:homocysteine S-methyltransferase|uniref:bifunctional homocysteine S-methyltransferase/methylenetetrahydrofolate reductase n=1 Tax=Salipaludibacillus agaradhaerens TaxID=76935 RepID=UPI00099638E8|nr:bifunctional homocysteine S-methyltransferase/methylenetetrahydrofolate reductase [Salipaludibacillus agaradhaerens]
MALLDDLQQKILVGDGAMGTFLYQQGIHGCFELLNYDRPEKVLKVHQQYIEAGADIIQTNTYAANRLKLRRYQLEHLAEEINLKAVSIAREAAGDHTYVLGTIGGISNVHLTEFETEEVQASFKEQADVLLTAGVDGILLETFYNIDELSLILRYLRQQTKVPIIAQVTLGDIGVLQGGISLKAALDRLGEEGADVVGLNCRMGPHHMLRSLEELPLPLKTYLSVYPNASLPNVRDGRFFYQSNPHYFGKMTEELVAEGARLIGGCCGTTPDHVKAIKATVLSKGLMPVTSKPIKEKRAAAVSVTPPNVAHPLSDVSQNRQSVIVELDPPKSLSKTDEFLKGTKALKEAGADAVTLADNSLASARIDNLSLGVLMKQQTKARPLLHLACRDRNLIGLQSHLLGLHTLGIHDVLAITGDPAKVGDFPGASSVYDMASLDLIKFIKQLNEGISFSGKDLGEKTVFTVAGAFNANARYIDKEVKRLERKIKAGADYFMSQPVYSIAQLETVYEATKHLPVPIYIGIMPLVSSRNAEFLHNEVPGIILSDDVRKRMATCGKSKLEGEKEGLLLAKELIDEAKTYFNHIYLITPFLRYEMTVELTRYIQDMSEEESLIQGQHKTQQVKR